LSEKGLLVAKKRLILTASPHSRIEEAGQHFFQKRTKNVFLKLFEEDADCWEELCAHDWSKG
jgi:hypothetical protein